MQRHTASQETAQKLLIQLDIGLSNVLEYVNKITYSFDK